MKPWEDKDWYDFDARYALAMWPHKHQAGNDRRCCWEAAYHAIFASAGQEAPEPTWTFEETYDIIKQ